MPVYQLVLHTYRSWNADNPRGYVRRGMRGVLAPDAGLAQKRAALAVHAPYTLDAPARKLCLRAARSACGYKKWRLHAVAVDTTHVHLVVSWKTDLQAKAVATALKRRMSLALHYGRDHAQRQRFSSGESRRRIVSADHLHELLNIYLPSHHQDYWCEGMPEV